MGKRKVKPERDAKGKFLPKSKQGTTRSANTEGQRDGDGGGNPPTGAAGNDPPHPNDGMAPRARVKQAQMQVLHNIENIVKGNCDSAAEGNYKCAEFVLDWSGISEIRTPLVKAKKKSLLAALMKQAEARKKAEAAGGEETE